MSTTIYRAATRGHANHGWLDSYHTFSFGGYYHPDRVRFGMLRVFNDDTVEGGEGFGTHPHENMEIISIPLEGTLVHQDSTGHKGALKPGDVQVMSAGTGITHSEFNGSHDDVLKFLQIWIIPNAMGVEPRYDEKHIAVQENAIDTVIGPKGGSEPIWIHQNAWLSLVRLDAGKDVTYTSKRDGNGIFLFMISGSATVAGESVYERDSIGVTNQASAAIEAAEDMYAVVIDVPMS